jgi:hypothetical protein
MRLAGFAGMLALSPTLAAAQSLPPGVAIQTVNPLNVVDDDFARHRNAAEWAGLAVARLSFRENDYDWQAFRITNAVVPDGPAWIVLHDSENPAFDSALVALRNYGGTLIAVTTAGAARTMSPGPKSPAGLRCQRETSGKHCDPNRNFGPDTPLFTATILSIRAPGQPVIAIHTNTRGIQGDRHGGSGSVSLRLASGAVKPGSWPKPPVSKPGGMNDDSFVLVPVPTLPAAPDAACGAKLVAAGINFYYERVQAASDDGSLSNHILLRAPGAFFNLEARHPESDGGTPQSRHETMVNALMAHCIR